MNLLRLRKGIPPGEGNLVLLYNDIKSLSFERLPYERSLGVHQLFQAVNGAVEEAVPGQAYGQSCGLHSLGRLLLRLGVRLHWEETFLSQPGDDLAVISTLNTTILGNDDVSNGVATGRHCTVDRFISGQFSNCCDHLFPGASFQVHFCNHALSLRS